MGYDRILAAMDASSIQPIVFEHALGTTKLHQAELKLLHCVEAEINPMGASTISPVGTPIDAGYLSPSAIDFEMVQKAWEAQVAEAKQWLQEYCRTAEQQGVRATFEAVLGNPEHQVCDLAQVWQADLIVVGRHGRTGLTEFFLGSVSNHVVHYAPCSVLVVQGESVVSGEST